MTARTRTRLAALLAASVVVLAGCGNGDDPEANDPNDTPTKTAKPGKTPKPSDESSPSESGGGTPEMVAVPVYFVGQTPVGPRLFREFRNVEADNPLEEATALMVAGDALDPDYESAFPDGGFESVSYSEGAGAIVVQVKDDGWQTPGSGMSKRDAKLAVQQLVYTVQGIQQERLPVLVQLGSDPVPLFGVDTSGGLQAAPPNDVLAFVNVTEPAQDSLVSGTFTASGVANSFEATVPWEIRDADGKQVLKGFATAEGWMDKLYPWESPVDVSSLAPGTYTFAAMTDDPSGGEGKGPTEDTKTITVQ